MTIQRWQVKFESNFRTWLNLTLARQSPASQYQVRKDRKWNRRADDQPGIPLVCDQKFATSYLHDLTVIVPTANFQVWGTKDVYL